MIAVREENRIKWWHWFCLTGLSMIAAFYVVMTFVLAEYSNRCEPMMGDVGRLLKPAFEAIGLRGRVADALASLQSIEVLIGAVVFAFLMMTGISLMNCNDKWLHWIYDKRWWIAAGILAVCLILQLNNTSLYYWSYYLGGAEKQTPLFGRARMIRSDEWAVWTPFAISQSTQGYPAINEQISGGGIDATWISVGGIPAQNLALFFKPLYWGFGLMGFAGGLSFLWTLRWLMLFAISFACAMIYTKRHRAFSVAAAAMITFSPYIQWWYSQSPAEVLIFGQGIVLCLYHYCRAVQGWKRWLLSALTAYCLGCYVMVGYPSWLISGMYVIAASVLCLMIKNRKHLKRWDIHRLVLPVAAAAAVVGIIVWQSWDTLDAVRQSVYPGSRLITGGNVSNSYFTGLYALLLPLKAPAVENPSALAPFVAFAPAGLILTLYRLAVLKQKDPFAWALLGIELLFGLFLLVGFPDALAKITLLSQCNRLQLALGMTDLVLLFRGMRMGFIRSPWLRWGLILLSTGLSVGAIWLKIDANKIVLAVMIMIYFPLFALIFHQNNGYRQAHFLSFAIVCIMFMMGALVNPIQQGVKCVSELSLVKALEQMNDGPEDLYAMEGDWPITNAPLLAGKRCWNSTQAYPNVKKWEAIDPQGKWEDIYNRFCHISLEFTQGETSVELVSTDHLKAFVNGEDLKKLGIEYLISKKTYEGTVNGCSLECLASADGFNIYQIK